MGALALAAAVAAPAAASACDTVRVEVRTTRTAVAPAPVLVRTWVPGRWTERTDLVVLREGCWRETVTPAACETRFDLCSWRFVKVCVRRESVTRTWVPPLVGERRTREWEPGRWTWVRRDGCCTS
jgi:hypothetical protein